ncbi:MAG: hypothetical protein H0V95_08550 [Actinobacteria bacterium]|nr:hypothetical protein [Actinomycetota bacterium]
MLGGRVQSRCVASIGRRALGSCRGEAQLDEITCPRWQRARHEGLRVHETKALDPIDLTFRDGIPITTPERLLLDLGAVCHQSVVEMAVDSAEHGGLVTVSSMRRTLERLGRPGRN